MITNNSLAFRHDVCYGSIHKIVKIAFFELGIGEFMGNVSALSLDGWKAPFSDNGTLSLALYLWHKNRNYVKVGVFRTG